MNVMASQITSLTNLLNRLFKAQANEKIKAPVTGELLAQSASNAENVSIWWRHHEFTVNQIVVICDRSVWN